MRSSNEAGAQQIPLHRGRAQRALVRVWASERGAAAGTSSRRSQARAAARTRRRMHHRLAATFVHLGGATTDDDAEIDSGREAARARSTAARAVSPREEVAGRRRTAHYFWSLRVGRYKLTLATINADATRGDLELDDDSPVMCIDGQPVTQLFGVVADPNERVDLFGLKEYEGSRATITRHAVNLLETESADLTGPSARRRTSRSSEAIARRSDAGRCRRPASAARGGASGSGQRRRPRPGAGGSAALPAQAAAARPAIAHGGRRRLGEHRRPYQDRRPGGHSATNAEKELRGLLMAVSGLTRTGFCDGEGAPRPARAAAQAGAARAARTWIYLHAIYNPLVFRRRVRAARASGAARWLACAGPRPIPSGSPTTPPSIQLMHMEVRDAAETRAYRATVRDGLGGRRRRR